MIPQNHTFHQINPVIARSSYDTFLAIFVINLLPMVIVFRCFVGITPFRVINFPEDDSNVLLKIGIAAELAQFFNGIGIIKRHGQMGPDRAV
jgi:hypothetical protein